MDLWSLALGTLGGAAAVRGFDHLREHRLAPAGLADLVNWAFMVEDGVVLQKDGSLVAGWRYHGPDLSAATPEELNALSGHLNDALLPFTDAWMFHVDAIRRPAVAYAPSRFPDPVTQLIDDERRATYAAQASRQFETEYFLIATHRPPPDVFSRVAAFFVQGSRGAGVDWGRVLEAFAIQLQVLENRLAGRLHLARLDADGLLTHLHECLTGLAHPVRTPPRGAYVNVVLADQELVGGFEPRVGRLAIRVVAVQGYPNASHAGQGDLLNALPFAFRWSHRVLPLGTAEAAKQIRRHQLQWFKKRKGAAAWVQEMVGGKRDAAPQRDEELWLDQDARNLAQDPAPFPPAEAPAAPLGRHGGQHAVPGERPRLGRGAHARRREDGLREVGAARGPRGAVPPLPRSAGVRVRRRVLDVGACAGRGGSALRLGGGPRGRPMLPAARPDRRPRRACLGRGVAGDGLRPAERDRHAALAYADRSGLGAGGSKRPPPPHAYRAHRAAPGPDTGRPPAPLHRGRELRPAPGRERGRPRGRPVPGVRDEAPPRPGRPDRASRSALSLSADRAAARRKPDVSPDRRSVDGAHALALRRPGESVALAAPKTERRGRARHAEPGAARPTRTSAHDRRLVRDEDLPPEPGCRDAGASTPVPRSGSERARDRNHRPGDAEAALLPEVPPREPAVRTRPRARRPEFPRGRPRSLDGGHAPALGIAHRGARPRLGGRAAQGTRPHRLGQAPARLSDYTRRLTSRRRTR